MASSAAGQETLIGIVGKDFVMLGADSSVSQSIALQSVQMDKIAVVSDPFPHSHEIARKEQQTILAAAAGDLADSSFLLGELKAQIAIREYESIVGCDVEYISMNHGESSDPDSSNTNNDCLSVEAVARLARGHIASSLRSQSPFKVCLLVAGMQQVHLHDEENMTIPFSSRLQQQVQRASRDFQQQMDSTTSAVSANDNDNADNRDLSSIKPRLYWLDSYGAMQKLHYGAHGLGANFLLSILDQGFAANMSREDALHLIQECFRQLRLRYVINSPQPPSIKCVDVYGCHVMK